MNLDATLIIAACGWLACHARDVTTGSKNSVKHHNIEKVFLRLDEFYDRHIVWHIRQSKRPTGLLMHFCLQLSLATAIGTAALINHFRRVVDQWDWSGDFYWDRLLPCMQQLRSR